MNRTGSIILFAALLFSLLAFSSPEPAYKKPVEMKMRWIEGKRYNMSLTVDDNEETMFHIEIAVEDDFYRRAECKREFSVTVAKTNSWGGAELDMELGEIRFYESAWRKSLDFNSRTSPDQDHGDPVKSWLRKMKGSRIKLRAGADGRVEGISNYDDYWNKITNTAPEEARELFTLFDEQSLKRIWFTTDILPSKPVLLRETWQAHREGRLSSGSALESDFRTTFRGVGLKATRDISILEFSGVARPKATDESRPSDWDSSVSTVTGHVWLDAVTGEVVEGQADYSIDLEFERQTRIHHRNIGLSYTVRLIPVADSGK